MSEQIKHLYEFGSFRLDTAERLLLSADGTPVPLQPKAFDILLALVRNGNHLVKKEDLMKAVWADAFVEEGNLTQNISIIRKALGAQKNSHAPQFIETVPRLGYRFVAPVRTVAVRAAEAAETEADTPAAEVNQTPLVISETETPHAEPQTTFEPAREKRDQTARRDSRLILKLSLATAILILLVGGVSTLLNWNRFGNEAASSETKSIAVLPFKNLSGGNIDDTLGFGLADALIAKLGNSNQLVVRPTSAVERYAGERQDSLAAGRELRVDFVLEGSVQRDGERVRVSARLMRTSDDAQVWASSFDERFTDIFSLQDRFSEQVAEALMIELPGEERRRLAKHYTENTEAYEAYLRGRFFWNKRQTGQQQAKSYFQRAMEIDSDYAPAYAGLAEILAVEQIPSLEAERAARRALEIDPTLAEAHAALGFIRMFHYWDLPTAERELRRAIELKPNYSTAHQWYALLLAVKGQTEEAKARMRRALEIDPLSVGINADMGQILFFNREYDASVRQCRQALELDSNFVFAHQYLFWIYFKKSMPDEAVEEILTADKIIAQSYSQSFDDRPYREAYAAGGIEGFLRLRLRGALAASEPDKYVVAEYYTLLGEKDEAIEWLRRGVNEPAAFFMIFVGVNPLFDDLRSDPRYQDTLRRVGLLP